MKITTENLKLKAKDYVDAAKQANGTFTVSKDNIVGLIDKIGRTLIIDGLFQDKLPELEGTELPNGRTIEEWFVDMSLMEAYSNLATEMAKENVPTVPSFEDCAWNYDLGRMKISTTIPYGDIEKAFNTSEGAAEFYVKISERLQNSYDTCRYAMKKQLLGNAISKALAVKDTNADVYKAAPIPTDAATSEDWIQYIKEAVEDASFAHEGGLNKAYIGAAPELTLFVLKGVMPTVAVKALAGAIQKDELAIPARIKVVDDFGTITGETDGKKVYAVLADPRGIKLCNSYNVTRGAENAEGDAYKLVRHFSETGFVSKYTFVRVFEG